MRLRTQLAANLWCPGSLRQNYFRLFVLGDELHSVALPCHSSPFPNQPQSRNS